MKTLRLQLDDLGKAFGDSEVLVAVVAGPELRYRYVNPGYRAIRPDVPMVGRTYRDVFPEAAEGGAEARLRSVIETRRSWTVEDYPTELPNRSLPAWWQGECTPVDLSGRGTPDAALILIWEVSHRHLPQQPAPRKSDDRLRIEAARAKLVARMHAEGLRTEEGWRVSEEVHEGANRTVWLLRPIHIKQVAPTGLVEHVAFVAEAGG